jgi:hypothetical protein
MSDDGAIGIAQKALRLLAGLTPVAPSSGVAAASQSTITSPYPVPSLTPFWVRVFYNGRIQKPGVDFTSNGTTTLTLNFQMSAGDDWFVEQLQRNPG